MSANNYFHIILVAYTTKIVKYWSSTVLVSNSVAATTTSTVLLQYICVAANTKQIQINVYMLNVPPWQLYIKHGIILRENVMKLSLWYYDKEQTTHFFFETGM